MLYHIYVESKNDNTHELMYKTDIHSQIEKINLKLPKGRRDKLGI